MQANRAISVIIPCWHDHAALAALLARLNGLAQRARQQLQLLVVDAANSPDCQRICNQLGAQWLASAPCRGQQLRQGAAQAQHSILWFLHADAQLLGNPLLDVQAVMSNGAVGGFFAFRFAGPSCWQSRLLEQLIGWRNRFGTPYGDQGLFVEHSAYLACGQHSPWPLFEEVDLVSNLRGVGDFQRIEHGLLVDPRRWQRDGWWRRSLSNRLLALAHACGVSAFTLARLYQRGHRPHSLKP